MTYEKQQVAAADGTRLMAYRWPARVAPRASVVIVHDLAEHARRYDRMARTLADNGIETHAFDLRGHGATTRAADHGDFGDNVEWPRLVDDIDCLLRQAADATPTRRPFVFGHGFGAVLALAAAQRRDPGLAGMILSGMDYRRPTQARASAVRARMESFRAGDDSRNPAFDRAIGRRLDRCLARRVDHRIETGGWRFRESAQRDRYRDDPDCDFELTAGSWHTVFDTTARSHRAQARYAIPGDLPLLLLSGSRDAATRFGRGPDRLARLLRNEGHADVALSIYDGLHHDLLHDPDADIVSRDIRRWILRRAGPGHPRPPADGRPSARTRRAGSNA